MCLRFCVTENYMQHLILGPKFVIIQNKIAKCTVAFIEFILSFSSLTITI